MSEAGSSYDGITPGRRNRPCDACRRRKSRCVLEKNSTVCVLCRFHGQTCAYKEAPAPRKRSAVPPVTEVETPPAASKKRKTIRRILGTGIEEYDTLPGPSLLKTTLGLQNLHHIHYLGCNLAPEYYCTVLAQQTAQSATPETGDRITTLRFVHPTHCFAVVRDDEIPVPEEQVGIIDQIEDAVLGHGSALIELYFRIIHPSFPVLHKEVFLEKQARSYHEFSPPLLAAVYLMASQYWNFEDSLASQTKPDVVEIESLAFASLHEAMRRPKLSVLQAGLLLSQYQTSSPGPAVDERYIQLTPKLVSLVYRLGLHIDCSDWKIPEWEIGLRRRLSWAIYMQDRWSAMIETRPLLLVSDEWAVRPLTEAEFPDVNEDEREGSSEVQRGRMVFMRMAELSYIVSSMHASLFSLRSRSMIEASPDQLFAVMERIKPAQAALWDWTLGQPEALSLEIFTTKLSSVGYLHFALVTVEVCMHRQILRALMMTGKPDPNLAHACRISATKKFNSAVDFIQRLQAQHLASFWYATSAHTCMLIFSLGRMLQLTATSQRETFELEGKLKEFKWALKVNSEAGATFMKKGLSWLQYYARITTQDNIADVPSTLSQESSTEILADSEIMPEPQGYPGFQPWLANIDPYSTQWAGEPMMHQPMTTTYNEAAMFDHAQMQPDGTGGWMQTLPRLDRGAPPR